jgi:MFS family permease
MSNNSEQDYYEMTDHHKSNDDSPRLNGERERHDAEEPVAAGRYLTGVRLMVICASLCLCIFMATAEVAIVSTSLVTISSDLSGFDKSNWLITTYLCTFTGFLLIWAKVGHLIGLKTALLSSLIFFIAFSAACGASETMDHLIVFRALQGIGGAGLMALPSTTFFQIVPTSGYPTMNALLSCSLATGLVVSPLIGGGLSNNNEWRWIFYLNLPIGAVAFIILALSLPNRFPRHADKMPEKAIKRSIWAATGNFLRQADIVGAFLLLGAIVFLVAALEEGGTVNYSWNSAFIIASFIISGCLLVALLLWQWWASKETTAPVPSFPRTFTHNRVLLSSLFGSFLVGAPMTISSIQMPQRYQLVNGNSPLDAGIKFLSYGVPFPVGIVISSVLAGRLHVPFLYIIMLGTTIQIVGFSLLSTTPDTMDVWAGQYGYSVIAGLGVGITIGLYTFLVPLTIDKKEQYLSVGAGFQARMLGGSVGVAVVNSVWVNKVRHELGLILSEPEVDTLFADISSLRRFPVATQQAFRVICSDAYNQQMLVTLGFVAAQVIAMIGLWRRPLYGLSKKGELI